MVASQIAPTAVHVGMDFGSIDVRVVVLPRKASEKAAEEGDEIVDLAADETLVEEGSSPVGSYLERQKGGKLCCVFLVNGQRQDGLDNSFIVQQLGFKYLRKRMMIIVDVDGLRPEALGELMQGSRQQFYKGRVWEAVFARLIATLKGDPDLQKLEEEAEAEVTQLQAGEQKVKETLDSLIDSHHTFGDHTASGPGMEEGDQPSDSVLGGGPRLSEAVVSLGKPTEGVASEVPVLAGHPGAASMSLRPGVERTFTVSADPRRSWNDLTSLFHEVDSVVPELHIAEERSVDSMTLRLRFDPPEDFDEAEYPVRARLSISGRFREQADARQVSLALSMAPAKPAPEPVLLVEPSFVKVTSRQPIRIWTGDADTHVRLRWDGRDDLPLPPDPTWALVGRCLTPEAGALSLTFSQPRNGRFSLLVGLPDGAEVGTNLRFEVAAHGPESRSLRAEFDAVVAERPPRPQPEPRLITSEVPTGAARRPPYDLKYVFTPDWSNESNFGGDNWTGVDAAAFQDPTEKTPLILIINQDMEALASFRKFLVARKLTESEVQSRLQKYTSHVYFHLYQMYQAAKEAVAHPGEDAANLQKPDEQKAEIRRVALTLLKLMQVSR